LRIVIESTENDKNYDLNTEITLDNLKLNDNNINGNVGLAVKYKTEYIETSEDESEDDDSPTIAIGSPDDVLKEGEEGSITFEVTTSNIDDNEYLDVSFKDYYDGLFLTYNQVLVTGNKATV